MTSHFPIISCVTIDRQRMPWLYIISIHTQAMQGRAQTVASDAYASVRFQAPIYATVKTLEKYRFRGVNFCLKQLRWDTFGAGLDMACLWPPPASQLARRLCLCPKSINLKVNLSYWLLVMLITDTSPYAMLDTAGKITKYSKLRGWYLWAVRSAK